MTKPFIVRFLEADERMDRQNTEEFSMHLFHVACNTSLTLLLAIHTEAIDCNHRVIVWNLLQHWRWDNIYEIPASVGDMKLSWIILDHISGFENHINSTGAVVLNTFEKAWQHYQQGQCSLYQKQWGEQITTNWQLLVDDLVPLLSLLVLPCGCCLTLFFFSENTGGSSCTEGQNPSKICSYLFAPCQGSWCDGVCCPPLPAAVCNIC